MGDNSTRLSSRLNIRNAYVSAIHAASDFHLLTRKFTCLFLACFIELVDSFMIAIGKYEFATAINTHESARFVVAHA